MFGGSSSSGGIVPDLSETYIVTNFSGTAVSYSGWAELDVGVLEDVEEGQVIGREFMGRQVGGSVCCGVWTRAGCSCRPGC